MWLLDVNTLDPREFLKSESVPPYAILSHTWGEDEVSFRDMKPVGRLAETRLSKDSELLRASTLRRIFVGLGRLLLHRQEEQRRAHRSHQSHVQMVPPCGRLLCLPGGCSPRRPPVRPRRPKRQVLEQSVVYSWLDASRISRLEHCHLFRERLVNTWKERA